MLSVHESIGSQKRAYSILDAVLTIHNEVLYEKEPAASILSVVCDSLMSCHVSARNMRLRCMESLVKSMAGIKNEDDSDSDNDDDDASINSDTIDMEDDSGSKSTNMSPENYHALVSAVDTMFLEVLICQKDANQKTRLQAKVLIDIFVKRLSLDDMMSRLLAASSSTKKTVRSSALLTICMVLLQHRNGVNTNVVQHQVVNLVPKVCLLLNEDSAELSRAVLTFLRVCVSILQIDTLMSVLPRITSAFCSDLGSHKARFVTRCRGIMRKLLNRLGESALRPYVPPDTIALLDYLVKQNRRQEAKTTARKSRSRSLEDVLLDSDDEKGQAGGSDNDDDNDGNLMDITLGATSSGKNVKAHKGDDYRITSRPKGIRATEEDSGGHSRVLLEDQHDGDQVALASSAPTLRPSVSDRRNKKKRKRSDSFDEEDSDSDGDGDDRRAAAAATSAARDKRDADIYDPEEAYRVKVGGDGMLVVEENTNPADTQATNTSTRTKPKTVLASAQAAADAGQRAANKRRKTKDPGEEYRSKKSGGDVWRKGMLEPHAYIPLDGRMLSRRNQREAVDKFTSVVRNKSSDNVRTPSHVIKGNRKQRVARRQKNISAIGSNNPTKRAKK